MKTSIAAALVGVGAALALAGACSGGASPIGASCQAAGDCASGFCTNGTCTLADGGTGGPDGGGGTDGGRLPDGGPIPDGGKLLPDGGVCQNLECQQVSCPDGGTTSVSGKVYDPSGQVPLYNAVVYVPNGQLSPFPDSGVSCDTCGAFTSGSPLVITLTDASGAFKLDNVPAGSNIPLVYQIGKWRRTVTLPSVPACQPTALTNVDDQRMPRNQSEGDIPQMAIATGNADPFECLLLKIGIDPAEFTAPTSNGRVHVYRSNGLDTNPSAPPATDLWNDAGTMARYDVVLLPCEGGEKKKPLNEVENLVNYTSSGGRVFATHYSYTWFADAGDPFPSTADWEPDKKQNYDPPSPFALNINTGFPKGQAFSDWLGNVNALDDAGTLQVFETRDDVWAVNSDGGSTAWLTGYNANAASVNPSDPNTVQHLTFNMPYDPPPLADGGPGVQCGRVVFSDFHVTTNALFDGGTQFPDACRPGPLTAQEKALVFMLFDVSSCVQSDTTAPTVCSGDGTSCGTDGDCCSGLLCEDSAGISCINDEPGTPCTCQVPFN